MSTLETVAKWLVTEYGLEAVLSAVVMQQSSARSFVLDSSCLPEMRDGEMILQVSKDKVERIIEAITGLNNIVPLKIAKRHRIDRTSVYCIIRYLRSIHKVEKVGCGLYSWI